MSSRTPTTNGQTSAPADSSREQALRMMVDEMEMGLAGFDHEGRLIHGNESFFKRLASSTLVDGITAGELRHRAEREVFWNVVPGLVNPPQVVTGDDGQKYRIVTSRHKEGPLGAVIQIQRPFHIDDDGLVDGDLLPVGNDDDGYALLRRFAHETRTLLTNIQGFSELMLADFTALKDKQDFTEWAGYIRDSSSAMLEEMSEMLELLQLTEGGKDFVRSRADLCKVIEQEFGAPPLGGEREVLVETVPGLLEKALAFLAGKLMHSAPAESLLSLEVKTDGNTALLSIRRQPVDDGSETGESPWKSVSGKTSGVFAIPLARAIIRMHGGKLSYREFGDGAAEYEITLPLLKVE